MTNVMLKTRLKPWMDVCLMVESSEFKWHAMDAQHRRRRAVEETEAVGTEGAAAAEAAAVADGKKPFFTIQTNICFREINCCFLLLYYYFLWLRVRGF